RKPLTAEDQPEVVGRFEAAYRRLYQRTCPGVPVEALGFRVVARGPTGQAEVSPIAVGERSEKGERPAYFPEAGGFVSTPVYDRYALPLGMRIAGPAILE